MTGKCGRILLRKPKWKGLFGRSGRSKGISDEYYNSITSFFLYSLDRPDDDYKTVMKHVTC